MSALNLEAYAEQVKQARQRHSDGAQQQEQPKPNGHTDPRNLVLTPAQWAAREIPPVDPIVGELLTRESRVLLSADTGRGKTMIGLALAIAAWTGNGFLHWQPGRKSRVLFLDGEMPAGAIKRRLAAALSWFGIEEPPDDGLYVLSTADVPDFKPLDTPEGQQWLDAFIQQIGGVDLIIFDNLQALTSLSLKEGDSWLSMKAWSHGLSARRIGQLWLHHTGLDTSRAYGDKAREWGMDTVIVADGNDLNGAGVNVTLRFPKARNRDPDDANSRAQFESVNLELRTGQWTAGAEQTTGRKKPLGSNEKIVKDALSAAIVDNAQEPPMAKDIPLQAKGVTFDQWEAAAMRYLPHEQGNKKREAFRRAVNSLVASGTVRHVGGFSWLP